MAGICTLALSRRTRNVTLLIITVALLWSASRTGLYSLGAGLLVAWILPLLRGGMRSFAVTFAAAAAGAVVVVLPLTNDSLRAFSDRGQIWIGSLDAWTNNPLTGNGINWYSQIALVNNVLLPQAFHGHNLFVHWLATGGVVLVLAVLIFLIKALIVARDEAKSGQYLAASYLVGFLVMAALEVNISFRDLTPTFWVMVVPLAVIVLQKRVPHLRRQHPVIAAKVRR